MTLPSDPVPLSVACVYVPDLPLQQALKTHPQWQNDPLVIVAEDRPTAPVLWASHEAQRHGIERGLPCTQAKILSDTLRIHIIPEHEINSIVDALFDLLLQHSPYVEPVLSLPGLFFLDPTGLAELFGNHLNWARRIQQALRRDQYQARIAVGFSRPTLYALCQTRRQNGIYISLNKLQEKEQAAKIPLRELHFSPKALDDISLLGIHTIGDFLALPSNQLRLRYNDDLAELHDFFSGKHWTPLQPRSPLAPLEAHLEVDPPDSEISRLLFGIKSLLHQLLQLAETRCEAITALYIHFDFEYGTPQSHKHESVQASAPTLDPSQLIDLVRLRLSTISIPAPICEITLRAESARIHPRQLHLHQLQHRRNLEAANRALARIAAQFGPRAINKAKLRSAHLPEARFVYESCTEVQLPRPLFLLHRTPLVRRLHRSPTSWPCLSSPSPPTRLDLKGNIQRLFGPYRIAGGWWTKPRERDYYFAETSLGDIVWVFYDHLHRRWLLHGAVH